MHRMRDKRAPAADVLVARIAARQHGVVSVAQLAEAGIGRSGIARRVEAGRLHRIHRGVYAVGHPGLCDQGRWMAAVLACGEGSVLSHRSAAALWALLPARGGPVDVTIPSSNGRARRAGIRLHRSPSLTDAATTHQKRIAVTTPARTITDLRRVAPPNQVRKAIRQAEFLDLDLAEMPSDRTNSELERLFLALLRRHRLPGPRSTRGSVPTRSTSSGAPSAWSSRPTAGRPIAAARPSRTTVSASSACMRSASACVVSPTRR